MTISRNSFDAGKNYKRVRYHQDRDLLDSELNEYQDIAEYEQSKMFDLIYKDGSIVSGLTTQINSGNVTISSGVVYIDGHIEAVPETILSYDPTKTTGLDYIYVELTKYNVDKDADSTLINTRTGEATAERERWVLALQNADTSGDPLPTNATGRSVVAVSVFDREANEIRPVVQEKSYLQLKDFTGTLPGSRITVSSISEDQLSFEAAEGLNSLLQNLAERTYDLAGNYLVSGLDSFIAESDEENVQVITNAGRAYVQGYRLQRDLPTTTIVPKCVSSKAVQGEQKTFSASSRRYALNNAPLKSVSRLEAVVEITTAVTRGSIVGGEDLLTPNPVVNILEVKQGSTVYTRGTDWQQVGNSVDWMGTANEPNIGTTYTVRWTYVKQMVKGTDYIEGGAFGTSGYLAAGNYFYLVTAIKNTSETNYDTAYVVSRQTSAGDVNSISWTPVIGATGYRIYRGTANTGRADFARLAEVGSTITLYIDDGVDSPSSSNPPASNTAGISAPVAAVALGNTSIVNFEKSGVGSDPVDGSTIGIDYEYFLGRKDVICTAPGGLSRIEGAPSDNPKLPVIPEGKLALCSVDCPANSTDMKVTNFSPTRVTMDQLHRLVSDVEDLKYNDAQFAMNSQLQNRDASAKKGIYSDDFSSDSQSDITHPDWSARIDTVDQVVAPARTATSVILQVDTAKSDAIFSSSLALLPGIEHVLIEQTDYSEQKWINPYGIFEKPKAAIDISPNTGRVGKSAISVSGSNFAANAGNITLRCDGIAVATGLTSDVVGRVSASFVIPWAARIGDRIVEMTDGTNFAQAKLKISSAGIISRIERIEKIAESKHVVRVPAQKTVWKSKPISKSRDPLAQTFAFGEDRVISSIGIYFTSKDAVMPITVQVRGVTTGLPNETVVAEKVVAPADISITGETKVVFDNPFYAEANSSYAIVLLTQSINYRVRLATLGKKGKHGTITKQAYSMGVLLESSDLSTWTPLNNSDLTMRVYGYDFASSGVVQFKPVTGLSVTDINIDEYSSIASGTTITWEYSMDSGVTWDALVPAEEELLTNVASNIVIRARFETNGANSSPALSFKDVNFVGYINATSGVYLTRESALTQGIISTALYAVMNIPSGTSVLWYGSNDGGTTWEQMTATSSRAIDQTWTEYSYSRTFTNSAGSRIRYKAVMTGTILIYPRIHSLGATLS